MPLAGSTWPPVSPIPENDNQPGVIITLPGYEVGYAWPANLFYFQRFTVKTAATVRSITIRPFVASDTDKPLSFGIYESNPGPDLTRVAHSNRKLGLLNGNVVGPAAQRSAVFDTPGSLVPNKTYYMTYLAPPAWGSTPSQVSSIAPVNAYYYGFGTTIDTGASVCFANAIDGTQDMPATFAKANIIGGGASINTLLRFDA